MSQSPSRKLTIYRGKGIGRGRQAGGENPTIQTMSLHHLKLSKAPHHTRNQVLTTASKVR